MICQLIEGKLRFKKENIKSMSLNSIDGSTYAVHKNHEPFISLIGTGNITFHFREPEKKEVYFVQNGIVKIQKNDIMIISFGKLRKIT